jgi:RimJ/RimL family protein N-acetyltransferase
MLPDTPFLTMHMQFRKLGAQDASNYRALRLRCLLEFPDNFGSTLEEESLQPELKFEQILMQNETDSFMIGAFADGQMIGLCGFRRETRKKTKHRGEIVQMYVSKEHAGKHIGSALLKTTIAAAFEIPEIGQITLSVVHQNEKANKVYEQMGFSEYGKIANYFKSGERYWDQRFMILYRHQFTAALPSNSANQ